MRIILLRKITLAKLFGPKVPDRHLMGFAFRAEAAKHLHRSCAEK